MPAVVQRQMEALFGVDFSGVRIHVSPGVAALGASALTSGPEVYFAPGQFDPGSPRGQRLLAHELTHVVQQRTGRVRNPFGSGLAVVCDPALEAEAERMALRAAQPRAAQPARTAPPPPAPRRIAPPGPPRALLRKAAPRPVLRSLPRPAGQGRAIQPKILFDQNFQTDPALQSAWKLFRQTVEDLTDLPVHQLIQDFDTSDNTHLYVCSDHEALKGEFGGTVLRLKVNGEYKSIEDMSGGDWDAVDETTPAAIVVAVSAATMRFATNGAINPSRILSTLAHEIALHAQREKVVIGQIRGGLKGEALRNAVGLASAPRGQLDQEVAHEELVGGTNASYERITDRAFARITSFETSHNPLGWSSLELAVDIQRDKFTHLVKPSLTRLRETVKNINATISPYVDNELPVPLLTYQTFQQQAQAFTLAKDAFYQALSASLSRFPSSFFRDFAKTKKEYFEQQKAHLEKYLLQLGQRVPS